MRTPNSSSTYLHNTRQCSDIGNLLHGRQEATNGVRMACVTQLLEHKALECFVHIEYTFHLQSHACCAHRWMGGRALTFMLGTKPLLIVHATLPLRSMNIISSSYVRGIVAICFVFR